MGSLTYSAPARNDEMVELGLEAVLLSQRITERLEERIIEFDDPATLEAVKVVVAACVHELEDSLVLPVRCRH